MNETKPYLLFLPNAFGPEPSFSWMETEKEAFKALESMDLEAKQKAYLLKVVATKEMKIEKFTRRTEKGTTKATIGGPVTTDGKPVCSHPVDICYQDETGGDLFTRPCDKPPHEGGNHVVNEFQWAGLKMCAIQAPGEEFAKIRILPKPLDKRNKRC